MRCARIVDDDIRHTELVNTRSNQRINIRSKRDVTRDENCRGPKLPCDTFTLAALQIGDNNARTLLHVGARNAFAKSARGTGDDCNFAGELLHVLKLIGAP